ncbi:pilus (MSHA type) biogenesis protein MshL [Chromatiales bacterium (ex Bugula neritina AB1)]|nr:pilus (MSHA type) biogenesis protein MshL [Chromatiales bacterium (ex Bugula neritina AB1)]
MCCSVDVEIPGTNRFPFVVRCGLCFLLPALIACQTVGPEAGVGQKSPKTTAAVTQELLSTVPPAVIPLATAALPMLPAPADTPPLERYSVVVSKVAADEILFALAQDSKSDLDLVGEIKGLVTLNAVNQPLRAILQKMARQVPMRYEVTGRTIRVQADVPALQSYRVDYLNISRSTRSRVDLATQIGSLSSGVDGNSAEGSNGSQMTIENKSENHFWRSLIANVAGILGEKYNFGEAAERADNSNIFVNRETGLITVRATSSQHRDIGALIDRTVASAQRQVFIEATVVEVTLSENFEAGVDWRILESAGSASIGFAQLLTGSPSASEVSTPTTGVVSYRDPASGIGDVSGTLKLLQQFGDVKVLSSPKIIALNNQPAILKVVDNRVYFTFEVDRLERENGDQRTIVDSTVHSLPVGLVMNVTPFINYSDDVILNVRPTISRILKFAEDPSPALAGQAQVRNLIPEIQVREMESVIRVKSGEVAIIGGLMQNKVDNRNTGLPGLNRIPLLGKLFAQDVKNLEKTELLVFLRPTVLRESASRQNYRRLNRFIPVEDNRLLMEANTASGLPSSTGSGLLR